MWGIDNFLFLPCILGTSQPGQHPYEAPKSCRGLFSCALDPKKSGWHLSSPGLLWTLAVTMLTNPVRSKMGKMRRTYSWASSPWTASCSRWHTGWAGPAAPWPGRCRWQQPGLCPEGWRLWMRSSQGSPCWCLKGTGRDRSAHPVQAWTRKASRHVQPHLMATPRRHPPRSRSRTV